MGATSFANDAGSWFILLAVPFAIQALLALLARRFIAVDELPEWRALWTTLPGYVIASIVMAAGFDLPSLLLAPLVSIPGALLTHGLLRRAFRHAWVQTAVDLPTRVKLARSDWWLGLAGAIALVAAATIKIIQHPELLKLITPET